MENQDTNQNSVAQADNSSRVAELLSAHFKSASSTKTAYSFLKVLGLLFLLSALWSNLAESSVQFTFPIVALLYIVFVFGQIIIKENDSKLKRTDVLAKTLTVVSAQYNELEEELGSYKQAFQNSKQVVLEWEKAHSYLKAENTNLTNNFSKLQDSYDVVSGRCNIAEKNIAKYKSELEGSDKIIKEAQSQAYIQAIEEYEELVTLCRSIPQLKDEDKKRFSEDRRDLLQKRIDLAKARSEK